MNKLFELVEMPDRSVQDRGNSHNPFKNARNFSMAKT